MLKVCFSVATYKITYNNLLKKYDVPRYKNSFSIKKAVYGYIF